MKKNLLNSRIKAVEKRGLFYIFDDNDKLKRKRQWLGSCFAPFYNRIMENSVFPKKFGADMKEHYSILKRITKDVHGKQVLELGTGSGSAVHFLPNDNFYIGTDIGSALLKQAKKAFKTAGFDETEFYVVSADDLPFNDGVFDLCLCILSLNFFDEIETVIKEVNRILKKEGSFICTVPVPERNFRKSTIHGTLLTESELREMCIRNGFQFESLQSKNGVLLYFKAYKRSEFPGL